MPSVPERLFGALSRICAVFVACVPLAAVGALCWSGVAAALRSHAVPVGGLASTALFTIEAGLAAAVAGGALGVGCALAAEELAPAPFRGAIGVAIGFLGAMPAVAFGWLAAVLLAPAVYERAPGALGQFAAVSAILAVMVAPTACSLVTRALRRVPDATRQAAAAAGASRLQTTALVVVPALRRRIAAALLAAFARALAEATALMIFFATLMRHGVDAAATTASWVFATFIRSGDAGQVSAAALALLVVTAACAFVVSREYRGMQWA